MRTALLLVALLAAATTLDARTDDRYAEIGSSQRRSAGALRLLGAPPDGLDCLPATKIVQQRIVNHDRRMNTRRARARAVALGQAYSDFRLIEGRESGTSAPSSMQDSARAEVMNSVARNSQRQRTKRCDR